MKKTEEQHPIVGHSYAVLTGSFVGEIFVFVCESDDNNYSFISIPKNINRTVPKSKFEYGLSRKIVEHVEKIQTKVFNLLKKQHAFNLDNNK
jgi:hypothetical protein